jgi:hypothetical protein
VWLNDKQETALRGLLEEAIRVVDAARPDTGKTLKQRLTAAHGLSGIERFLKDLDLPEKSPLVEDVQNLRSILGELDEAIDCLLGDFAPPINYHTAPTWASQNLESAQERLKGLMAGLDYAESRRRPRYQTPHGPVY